MSATLRIVTSDSEEAVADWSMVLAELTSDTTQAAETSKARVNDWARWRDFLGGCSDEAAFRTLTGYGRAKAKMLLDEYYAAMTAQGLAPNTIRRRFQTLTRCAKLANDYGIIEWTISAPRVHGDVVRDVEGPSTKSIASVMASLQADASPLAKRNLAMIRLMADLALRASSLTTLTLDSYDRESKSIRVWAKRHHRGWRKKLLMPDATCRALDAWIEERGNWPGAMFVQHESGEGAPFSHWTSTPVTRQVIHYVTVSLGLGNPHGLRHTACTEAVRYAAAHGIPLAEVLEFSGHATVKNLERYVHAADGAQKRLADAVADREV